MITPNQFQVFYCDTCCQKFPAIPDGNWKFAKHSCGSDGLYVYEEKEFESLWGWIHKPIACWIRKPNENWKWCWIHKQNKWKSDPQRQAILKRIFAETEAQQVISFAVVGLLGFGGKSKL